ncbi:MAG: hypothetical protein KDB62_08100 [Solirubrobacterales bacterium]|nr:hypothetical protein [Solirubrobacterales bacterium]
MKSLWGMRSGSTAGALIAMFLLLGPGGATAASPGPDGVGSGSLNAATSAGTGNLSIGKTTLVARGAIRGEGKAYLLVPIVYPIDMSGRGTEVRVSFRDPNGQKVKRVWEGPLTAGLPRPADRRTGFRFIHEIRIGIRSARRMLTRSRGAGIRVRALARVDIEGDGRAELDRVASRIQRRVKAAGAGRCASSGLLRARSGGLKSYIRLPRCGHRVQWEVTSQPTIGIAEVRQNGVRGVYFRDKGRYGADQFEVTARVGKLEVARRLVQVRSNRADTDPDSVSIRAMGDSVTAGFGYYGKTGKEMGIGKLLDCKPADDYYNDACSSNSANTSSTSGPDPRYLPDYGLSRNISWAAKWANEYGITDYKNYAVTGSAPSDWLGSGQFSGTFRQIQAENPDFVVMTMGANPLLSDMLFGIDNMGCAIYSDLFGDYRDCIEQAFAGVDLSKNLHEIYSELVANTTSHIVLMQYHLSVPSSALAYSSAQIELMGELLNDVIATQAASVSTDRITVVSPPRFNVGIDMEPLYPARYSCSWRGDKVDGPSVQSTPTQDELLIDHPFSFCKGPPIGPPWVISGDTGIHPSAAGYAQMASQLPRP